ncbi:hypothetical protein NPIL_282731 [Nephila pilipes]|uniref:Uncharacterized protein n=1 Tax=Nephila pilipes TaxID=299642 RepID=A0A8X6NE92_NEPPI|nr:hypothetical protein NPIL_282731 [Nephila pilipes]
MHRISGEILKSVEDNHFHNEVRCRVIQMVLQPQLLPLHRVLERYIFLRAAQKRCDFGVRYDEALVFKKTQSDNYKPESGCSKFDSKI